MKNPGPWLENKKWAKNEISSGEKLAQYWLWGVALFWNLVSSTILLDYQGILSKAETEPVTLVAFLFLIVGAGLVLMALKMTLKWRRFGQTPLRLDPFPGSLGGHVGGRIDTNIPFSTSIKCAVSLSCLHSKMSGSGKNRSRRESVQWQSEGYCDVVSTAKGTGFNFRFTVPDDLPESDVKQNDSYNLWRVSLNAPLEGSDFVRQFEIPVFATQGQSSSILSGAEDHLETQASAMQGVESVADVRSIPGGVEVWFPAFQRPQLGIMLSIFGLVFGGIGLAVPVGLMITIIFTGMGLLLLVLGVLYLGKALLVEVTSKGIKTRRFFLGLPITTRQMPASDFKKFEIKKSGSISSGRTAAVIYQIYAHGNTKKVQVAERLIGRPEVGVMKDCFEMYLPSKSI